MADENTGRASAVATIQADNDRVRVVEWAFAPGAETGQHVHEYDYVVVPQTDGVLKLETPEGEATAELQAGQSYYRQAGVSHNVINAGRADLVFVEIEMKAHPIAGE
jgi:quercetin dioxygenase-like cupin family protein